MIGDYIDIDAPYSFIGGGVMEPEIIDLGNCLKAMGAKIDGLGTKTVFDFLKFFHPLFTLFPNSVVTASENAKTWKNRLTKQPLFTSLFRRS